jgi:hypothetical protein
VARDPKAGLIDLAADDLAALRLAAQVMAHRAQLAGRPAVALYFDSLEASVLAEQAARAQAGDARPRGGASVAITFDATAGIDDRLLIGQYLALLADNGQLPDGVRDLCRSLRQGGLE